MVSESSGSDVQAEGGRPAELPLEATSCGSVTSLAISCLSDGREIARMLVGYLCRLLMLCMRMKYYASKIDRGKGCFVQG